MNPLEKLEQIKENLNRVLDLSICVITYEQDYYHLSELYKSLPENCELVILYTDKDQESKEELKKETGINIKSIYKDFTENGTLRSFSEAKNYCKSFATRDWILFIDSDERLMWDTYKSELSPNIFQGLGEMPENLGGAFVKVASDFPITKKFPQGLTLTTPQIRLFRNKPEINFEKRCHEQIYKSLQGYQIGVIDDIRIRHLGYSEVSEEKLMRNINLMIKDLAEEEDEYTLTMLYRSFNDLNNLGKFKEMPYGFDVLNKS